MHKPNKKHRVEPHGVAIAIEMTATAKREALPAASVATQPTGF